jgi:hypothetical protein
MEVGASFFFNHFYVTVVLPLLHLTNVSYPMHRLEMCTVCIIFFFSFFFYWFRSLWNLSVLPRTSKASSNHHLTRRHDNIVPSLHSMLQFLILVTCNSTKYPWQVILPCRHAMLSYVSDPGTAQLLQVPVKGLAQITRLRFHGSGDSVIQ